MKIAVKNKSEMKYIDSEQLQVGELTLLDLYSLVDHQQHIIKELIDAIEGCHIVKKDTEYLIKINNRIEHITDLEIVAVEKLKYPLRFYTIEDGKLIIDKKKVVAL